MDFYWTLFAVLAVIVALLLLTQVSEGTVVPQSGANVASYRKHMQSYVAIYSLMMCKWRAGASARRAVRLSRTQILVPGKVNVRACARALAPARCSG